MSERDQSRLDAQERRRRVARKRRRQDLQTNVLAGVIIVGTIVGVMILLIAFGALCAFLAWNFGVYGIDHAAGGHVAKISFWTALGVGFVIGVLSRPIVSIRRS